MSLRTWIAAAIMIALTSGFVVAQEETTFALKNGLHVVQLPGGQGGLASVMLVCPLPEHATAAELADISLINRLIWLGGEAQGTKMDEHEFRMITLRFGGSISSQVVADALIVQYIMPSGLTTEILRQLMVQWNGLRLDPQRLESLKQELAAREKAGLTASVQNQLMRQVEKRLWPDFPYANPGFGSEEELTAATADRINATYGKLRNPARWTLFLRGEAVDDALRAKLEETLGTIPVSTLKAEPFPPVAGPVLGTTYQLPASLTNKHAIMAWRLPAAVTLDQEALFLFAETMRRSPQLEALKQDLAAGGTAGDLLVGVDIRKDAGSFYLIATWNGTMERDEAVARLRALTESVSGEGAAAQAYAAALKAQKIRYWTRRSSVAAYVNWRGLRASIGVFGDSVPADLDKLTPEAVKKVATGLLTKENSLILETVTP